MIFGSESTMDVFNNPNLLTGVHMVNIPRQTIGVGGKFKLTFEGGLVPGNRDVWLDRDNPANILSLARI